MPKNIPKEGINWGVETTMCDPTTGKPICKANRSYEKVKIRMADAQFANGEPQSLYFLPGHPCEGVFKGMAVILKEWGFGNMLRI
jgi:hypothetical protein